jgi:predicted methyltransferase
VSDWRKSSKVISENPHCQFPYCELPNQNSATQETTVEEPAKKTSVNAEAIEQQSIMLTVQVLWACHAWNTTPEEAAKQVVADLYEHLSRGGSVSVQVEELGGKEYTVGATAKR